MATKKTPPTNLFAVIDLGGKQYLVKNGETLRVAKLPEKVGESLTVDKVLLVINGEDTLVGAPYVAGAKVSLKHDQIVKGEKMEILKYRAKSRYRRHLGHRQEYSQVTVAAINLK